MFNKFVAFVLVFLVNWVYAEVDSEKYSISKVDFVLKSRDLNAKSPFKILYNSVSGTSSTPPVNETHYLSFSAKFYDENGPINVKLRHVAVLLEADNPNAVPTGFEYTHTLPMEYTESASDNLPYRCTHYLNETYQSIAKGYYNVKIIVGDSTLLGSPYSSVIDSVKLNLMVTNELATALIKGKETHVCKPIESWYPKPPIFHQFAEPPRRSSPLITLFFFAFVVIAFPTHVYTIMRIGSNIDYFCLTLTNVLFSLCLVSCAVVLIVYWVALNLPTALAILLPLSLVTSVFGNAALNESRERSIMNEAKLNKKA